MKRLKLTPTHHPADATTVELTDALAEELHLLRAVCGSLAFLTPDSCASCGHPLPAGPRDHLGIDVLNNQPVVFFLCHDCRTQLDGDPHRVEDRVHDRIDLAVQQAAMRSWRAEA